MFGSDFFYVPTNVVKYVPTNVVQYHKKLKVRVSLLEIIKVMGLSIQFLVCSVPFWNLAINFRYVTYLLNTKEE